MGVNDIISSGLLELYAAGVATPAEAAQVLEWAAVHPEVREELAQIEAGLESYAQINAVAPAPEVKQRVMALINNEAVAGNDSILVRKMQPEPLSIVYIRRWKMAAAAAVVLLAGSAVLNLVLFQKNSEVNNELLQAREVASSMESTSREMEAELRVVQNKYSLAVSLKGLETLPNAAAKVFWLKHTGEVYVDPSNLPAAPKGKQYELWAIVSGKPVNAGIIVTTKKGNRYVIQKMKSFGSAEAFAVSLEPSNPLPAQAPTDVVVMGKM